MKTRGVVLLLLTFALPFSAMGAPVFPLGEAGTIVCLFESGTEETRNGISQQDTLIVYRQKSDTKYDEVGKIVVQTFAGDYYIQGIVVEGAIKEKDVAKKGTIACLVVLLGEACNHGH